MIKPYKNSKWITEFRTKYDQPDFLHVTLISGRYVEEGKVNELKSAVAEALSRVKIEEGDRKIIFNELAADSGTKSDDIFMINSAENKFVTNIQEELKIALCKYNNYLNPITKNYEDNFTPHITVARDFNVQKKEEMMKYFPADFVCEGEIESLAMPILNNATIEERMDLKNIVIFKL